MRAGDLDRRVCALRSALGHVCFSLPEDHMDVGQPQSSYAVYPREGGECPSLGRRGRHRAVSRSGSVDTRHIGQHFPHEGIAADHSRHGVIGMHLVLEIDEA